MTAQYNNYLRNHRRGVMEAYDFLVDSGIIEYQRSVRHQLLCHDESKYLKQEYDAYDDYFYSDVLYGNITQKEKELIDKQFKYAWLHHIHENGHHWQHWVLIHDSYENHKEEVVEMPRNYALEMFCDWWSFSWVAYHEENEFSKLFNVFDWYNDNKHNIKLHNKTKEYVEQLLALTLESLQRIEQK